MKFQTAIKRSFEGSQQPTANPSTTMINNEQQWGSFDSSLKKENCELKTAKLKLIQTEQPPSFIRPPDSIPELHNRVPFLDVQFSFFSSFQFLGSRNLGGPRRVFYLFYYLLVVGDMRVTMPDSNIRSKKCCII